MVEYTSMALIPSCGVLVPYSRISVIKTRKLINVALNLWLDVPVWYLSRLSGLGKIEFTWRKDCSENCPRC